MPRQPDPDLEDRILTAARRLWKKGAGKALTMRAVARAARTNTPAVYRRFRRREDILRALLLRTRQEIFEQLGLAPSVEDAFDRYIDFALSRPHEYELYFMHEYELLLAPKPARALTLPQLVQQGRPTVEMMMKKFAGQLGGAPEDYARLTLAVWTMLHGTAMLLISKNIHPEHAGELRSVCRASLQALLRQASQV